MLSANQFNRRRDFPADYRTRFGDDPDVVVTRGGSCIVDPFGDFLAGPNTQGEAILTAKSIAGKSFAASSTWMLPAIMLGPRFSNFR